MEMRKDVVDVNDVFGQVIESLIHTQSWVFAYISVYFIQIIIKAPNKRPRFLFPLPDF